MSSSRVRSRAEGAGSRRAGAGHLDAEGPKHQGLGPADIEYLKSVPLPQQP
ncbi:hypothetical protein HMPREF1317_0043 [Schaalia georgiae F0490]|uniref:Uncharacterized protein n=1 Tax=Schaalia georgiae F0490 TaxID=1125717 RepID=J1GTS6_9ACTO|nr:hypothetical protein HMPREF1317_0043 [Schaalia georgiae F0490]